MKGIHGGRDTFRVHDYEDVEATTEQVELRTAEWLEQIQAHPAELVLTHDMSQNRSGNTIRIGVIRDDITDEELDEAATHSWFRGPEVSGPTTLAYDFHTLRLHERLPIAISRMDVEHSFDIRKPKMLPMRGEEEPQFELIVGDEAVAKWFADLPNYRNTYAYYLVCKKLGVEPVPSEALEQAKEGRKQEIMAKLIKLSFDQQKLTQRIDAVMATIGKGVVIGGGGLAPAPESAVEAAMRVHGEHENRDRNSKHINDLKAELADLGATDEEIGQILLEILNLRLPEE